MLLFRPGLDGVQHLPGHSLMKKCLICGAPITEPGGEFFNEFSRMLEDEQAVSRAAIPVERINGPILLL